jgi:hypothetical protein
MTTKNEDMTSLTQTEATDNRILNDSGLDVVSGGLIGLGNFAQVAARYAEITVMGQPPCTANTIGNSWGCSWE